MWTLKSPVPTFSVWFGFLWATFLPAMVSATLARGLPIDLCRASRVAAHASEWWRWWEWSDTALAWLFASQAGVSLLVAFVCIAMRASGAIVFQAALWLTMASGAGVWLLLSYLLFWFARCAAT